MNRVIVSFHDTITSEKAQKKNIKYYFTLKLLFHKNKNIEELTDPPISFQSKVFTLLDANIDEVTEHSLSAYQTLVNQIEEFQRNGSDWVLERFIHLDLGSNHFSRFPLLHLLLSVSILIITLYLGVVQYDPLHASSYLALPKYIKDKKACINIKNDDQKCFLWSVLASLYPQSHHVDRVCKYRSYENDVDMSNISYPVKVSDINKFETMNNISVNVFGLDDELKVFPVRISSLENVRHRVDLLYFAEEETSHYVLIKNLSRLVSAQLNNSGHQKYICKYCLHGCSSQEILDKHVEKCRLHGAQCVKLPEPDENKLFFKKTKCQLRLPFVIYADFESILKPHSSAEQIFTKSWTQIYQTHEACGFGMYTVCTDKQGLRRRGGRGTVPPPLHYFAK